MIDSVGFNVDVRAFVGSDEGVDGGSSDDDDDEEEEEDDDDDDDEDDDDDDDDEGDDDDDEPNTPRISIKYFPHKLNK